MELLAKIFTKKFRGNEIKLFTFLNFSANLIKERRHIRVFRAYPVLHKWCTRRFVFMKFILLRSRAARFPPAGSEPPGGYPSLSPAQGSPARAALPGYISSQIFYSF